MQESLQGEPGGKVADAQQRVHLVGGAVGIGIPVRDDDVFENEGVEGLDGDPSDLHVCVNPVPEHPDGLAGQGGLYGGRLDDDEQEQQQKQDCRKDPYRYAKPLFHYPTKIGKYSLSLHG